VPSLLQVVLLISGQKKAAEKKEAENTKEHVVQLDDLLTFRQFSRKSADDPIDVGLCHRLIIRHSFFFPVRGGLRQGNGSC
jgi:hypothetical protein